MPVLFNSYSYILSLYFLLHDLYSLLSMGPDCSSSFYLHCSIIYINYVTKGKLMLIGSTHIFAALDPMNIRRMDLMWVGPHWISIASKEYLEGPQIIKLCLMFIFFLFPLLLAFIIWSTSWDKFFSSENYSLYLLKQFALYLQRVQTPKINVGELKNIIYSGHLGGSVSWLSDSWFWLR